MGNGQPRHDALTIEWVVAVHATYLGANGWLLEIGGLRLLVDPWLQGDLVFPPGPWLLRGQLGRPLPAPENLDLLLLTQGLADHCHAPSLELLPNDLPVVGSASAASRVRQLGFTTVTALAPGERTAMGELTITATAGAPVPAVENGYLLQHPQGRLYLEPHGFLPEDLPAQALDAVISPVVDVGLPLAGAIVKGKEVLPRVLERFDPLTVLASATGGDVRFSGLLSNLFQLQGTLDEAAAVVERSGRGRRLLDPVPGERYGLAVRDPAAAQS